MIWRRTTESNGTTLLLKIKLLMLTMLCTNPKAKLRNPMLSSLSRTTRMSLLSPRWNPMLNSLRTTSKTTIWSKTQKPKLKWRTMQMRKRTQIMRLDKAILLREIK